MLLWLPFDAKCYFSIFLLCVCVAHASHGENIHYVSSCLAKHTFSDQWLTITGQRVRVCVCAKYVASLELLLLSSIFLRFAFHFAVSAKVVYKTRSNDDRVSLCRMIYLLAVEFVGDDDTISIRSINSMGYTPL